MTKRGVLVQALISSLSSRSYACFFIFPHSTFDVGRSMFDVHLFHSLIGKNNLALMRLCPWTPIQKVKKTKAKRSRSPQEAEAQVADPEARASPVPIGRADVPGLDVPATAPEHPVGSAACIYGIIPAMFTVGIFRIYVLTPLPYIAAHVISAKTVWLFGSYRMG